MTEPASVAETHLSVVLLVGDRALKLPKPVRLAFVDQSTPELRRTACEREVALNRRLAPDVYLGVLDLVRDGRAEDHLIEMRRMPGDRRLATIVGDDARGADEVRAVARRLAAFHADAARSPAIAAAGSPDAVRRLWDDNLAEMASFAGTVFDPEALGQIGDAAHRYLDGRGGLLGHRQDAGFIVDGHGDLLADDIFCLPDGPRILDCLAFDDRLRHGDVLLDLAFLAMDLQALGRRDLADLLLHAYGEFSGEHHPDSLAHHYIAYRALVRAKVGALGVDTQGEPAAERARARLALSQDHLDRGRVRLVLVGGSPGTGKTTLAAGLGDLTGWSVLDSDEMRKDLAGLPHHASAAAPFGEGLYRPEVTETVYTRLLDQAGRLLEAGESVVFDASWTSEAHRAAARAMARAHHADLVELRCVSSPAVVRTRVTARARQGGVATDADPEIARHLAQAQDPWPTAVDIDTEGTVQQALVAARVAVGR
jgi:aminoglycoside phosphotransferase family enzyme/predicted kinase